MSNRRRAQRRDAHGAPLRSRQEVVFAILTALAVLAVTAVLIVALRHRTPSTDVPNVVSTSTPPASSATVPATPESSTPAASTPAASTPAASTPAEASSSTTQP